MEVEIRDFACISHMDLKKAHLQKKAGIIHCPNMPLHGKHVVRESKTTVIDFMAGKYGKTSECWYLADKNSPMFKTFEALVKNYHK